MYKKELLICRRKVFLKNFKILDLDP